MKNKLIKRIGIIMVMSLMLAGCAKSKDALLESMSSELDEEPKQKIDYSEYAGEYQDSFSQRASMSAEDMGDALKLTVNWSSSATESSIWTMTAKFDELGKLSYSDCEYGIIVFDDDGNDTYTKEYDSGEGYFTLMDEKLYWDGAADESCRDCVFEIMNFDFENTEESREIRHIEESIDIFNLPDGTYPVKILFDKMKRNEGSLSLDFMIYTVIHYNPEDINNMKRDDIIYEYVDETTTKNYVIDTVNFPVDEVCVINGGSERGEGLTLSLDETGLFRVSVYEVYTRNESHGIVTMEIPDAVSFSDNHDLSEKLLSGEELYNYFNGLSDSEKEYFNENNTFLTVTNGKVVDFYRIYLP